ncbi:hypothetical protein JCM1841_000679 [Sporobolomyces salmonicolor]
MARGIVSASDSIDSPTPAQAVPPPPAQPPELTDPSKISLRAPPLLRRVHQAAIPIAQPDSTSTSQESSKEDSGGLGNESDDEADEGEGGSEEAQGQGKSSSDDQLPRVHHEMYPAALSPGVRRQQRLSSAEVEASSAGSDSSSWNGGADSEGDVKMESPAVFVKRPRRSLTEYRDSLTRAGLDAPTKFRRIGALGISVHSDSDVDNPQVSGLDSADRLNEPGSGGDTSGGTRETDLGVSLSNLQAGTGSGSDSGDQSPGQKMMVQRRKRGVADAMFRGIVDELAVENRHLKERLKRYEAHGVPVELKKTRLFEIRFFNSLPADRRFELEEFLTNYVQDFIDDTATSPPPSQSADRASRPTLQPFPACVSPHPVSPQLSRSPGVPSRDRHSPHLRRAGLDAPLAGPSNSGVEPPSVSGIGSGLYRRPSQQGPSASTSALPTLRSVQPPAPAIRTRENRIVAIAVVQALEQLFRHSLHRPLDSASTASPFFPAKGVSDGTTSNEAYMANLLNHDFLSQGWVYLNLASTMAQIHRFSVTLNFVQQAVREYSAHLQVSDDGGRIRWIGELPSPPYEPLWPPAPVRQTNASPSDQGSLPSSAPTEGKSSTPLGPSATQVRSASTDSSQSSVRDPSSGEITNNNSFAPTASTAATSQHASTSNSKLHSNSLDSDKLAEQPAKPVRPTAAVLQPMSRLSASPFEVTDSPQRPTSGERATPSLLLRAQQQQQHTVSTSAHRELLRSTSFRTPQSTCTVLSAQAMQRPTTIFHRLARGESGETWDGLAANSTWPEVPTVAPDRAGTLIFYANGHFCSDLSKDRPEQIPVQGDFVPGIMDGKEDGLVLGAMEAAQSQFDGLDEPKPFSSRLDGDAALLDKEVDPGLLILEKEGPSADSHGSSLLRLGASGMTTSIPADIFTVFVKTRYPPKRSLPLSISLDLERFDPRAAVSSKRRRLEIRAPKILSAKAVYHHSAMVKRDPRHFHPQSPDHSLTGLASFSQLTRSNLAKHTQPPLPSPPSTWQTSFAPAQPGVSGSSFSPPHNDYLVSLSAPSHTWSPHERGLHSKCQSQTSIPPTVGRGSFGAHADAVQRKKAVSGSGSLGVSATGGGRSGTGLSASTSDEGPISLDEVVGTTAS